MLGDSSPAAAAPEDVVDQPRALGGIVTTALLGVIAMATILPCVVQHTAPVEDDDNVEHDGGTGVVVYSECSVNELALRRAGSLALTTTMCRSAEGSTPEAPPRYSRMKSRNRRPS